MSIKQMASRLGIYSKGRELLRSAGVDMISWSGNYHLYRRIHLLRAHGITLLFDIGASFGQYVGLMRDIGYDGRVVSYEPTSHAFAQLRQASADDPLWTIENAALGAQAGSAVINLAENSVSSSILALADAQFASGIGVRYSGRETITVLRLDQEFARHAKPDDKVYLKLDVQGFEKQVLEGGRAILDRVALVQMEAALRPTYAGEMKLEELLHHMAGLGFRPVSIEPGHADGETGEQYEVDVIFARA